MPGFVPQKSAKSISCTSEQFDFAADDGVLRILTTGDHRQRSVSSRAYEVLCSLKHQPTALDAGARVCRELVRARYEDPDLTVFSTHLLEVAEFAGPDMNPLSKAEEEIGAGIMAEIAAALIEKNDSGPLFRPNAEVSHAAKALGSALGKRASAAIGDTEKKPEAIGAAILALFNCTSELAMEAIREVQPAGTCSDKPILCMGPSSLHANLIQFSMFHYALTDGLFVGRDRAAVRAAVRFAASCVERPLHPWRLEGAESDSIPDVVKMKLSSLTRLVPIVLEGLRSAVADEFLPVACEAGERFLADPSTKQLPTGMTLPSGFLELVDSRGAPGRIGWSIDPILGTVESIVRIGDQSLFNRLKPELFHFTTAPWGAGPANADAESALYVEAPSGEIGDRYAAVSSKLAAVGLGWIERLWDACPNLFLRSLRGDRVSLHLLDHGFAIVPLNVNDVEFAELPSMRPLNDAERAIVAGVPFPPTPEAIAVARFFDCPLREKEEAAKVVSISEPVATEAVVDPERRRADAVRLERKLLRDAIERDGGLSYDGLKSVLATFGVTSADDRGKGSHGRLERMICGNYRWSGTWHRIRESTQRLPMWFISECLERLEVAVPEFCIALHRGRHA